MRRSILLVLAGVATSLAVSCPDYSSMSPPALPGLSSGAGTGFRSYLNRFLGWLGLKSNHLITDQMVANGTSATMVGKFEYDVVMRKDLEGEDVHVFVFGTGMNQWESLGTQRTDRKGKVYVDLTKPVGEYTIAMVVAGDLSTVYGYLTVMEPGLQAVLFDIGGTLTNSDIQLVWDLVGIKKASAYEYAKDVVLMYKEKGYKIVYLTARQYWLSRETREWLAHMGLPQGHLRHKATASLLPFGTVAYKTEYIAHLRNLGLDIIRVYGNAETDITAYQNSNFPNSDIYTIGSNAGSDGTQAIVDDYGLHLLEVVSPTPAASCAP